MLVFYDFEVFQEDWLVVLINPLEERKTVIVNDKDKLLNFYQENKNNIWIGYNNKNYDQYILKSIFLNFNPKTISDYIIVDEIKGYQIDKMFKQIQMYNYDVMNKRESLKLLEAFMGNDIRETSVPFDIRRKLTDEEIEDVIKYCTHDVEQTIEVFLKRKIDFDAQMDLIKNFNLSLNCLDKTQAQLISIILNARKKSFYDDWEIRIPETLKLEKYKFISDWFLDKKNQNVNSELKCVVSGVEHIFAWGGLHGSKDKFEYTCKEDEMLVMADVDQFYPTLMIKYKLLSRAVKDYDKFKFILETSLRLKKENRTKEREPYKRMCNIAYGAMGDEFNLMYDPLHRKLVCIYGQLFFVDLIEKIEPFAELIQSNTDGILIKIKNKDFDLLDDTVFEWEERIGVKMSFKFYKTIIQKDVNNYIAVDYDGNAKRKGGYIKKLDDLDNDLPIVNEAVFNYLTKKNPVEETIKNCNELKMFQKVVKLSNKYKYAYHNGERLTEKTFRVFASNRFADGYIGKQKEVNATIEKFANTPANCFIDNSNVNGKEIPNKLDKQWYIDLANKRIADYGINQKNYEQIELF